jgi:hypothetical protein
VSPDGNGEGVFRIDYRFALSEDRVREFHVRLRRDTLALITEPRGVYPPWTALAYQRCSNCRLSPGTHPRCPVAANLVDVVEYFKDVWSCEEADVEITVETRTYTKRTSVQNALSALAGIYMVTSGCPVLDKLRPMVYIHAPFGGLEETLFRAASIYCLAQFFRQQDGKQPDWALTGLADVYREIETVNRCFHQRIVDVAVKEAGLNALLQLNCYAQYTSTLYFQDRLQQIKPFFQSYLTD